MRKQGIKRKHVRKNVEEHNVPNKNMKNIFSCACLSFRLYSVGCLPTHTWGERADSTRPYISVISKDMDLKFGMLK